MLLLGIISFVVVFASQEVSLRTNDLMEEESIAPPISMPFGTREIENKKFVFGDSLLVKITFIDSIINHGPGKLDSLHSYIAVPINRIHQEILGEIWFSREPEYLIDEWGQVIAFYEDEVSQGTELVNQYEICVKTRDVVFQISPDDTGDIDDIPQEIRDIYTVDAKRYCIHDSVIVDAASEAVGDETNFYWKVRKIHDYVIDHLYYNNDHRWDSAPTVLKQGHGSCTEYSWLMIALCRVIGIPVRYVGGSHLRSDPPYIDIVKHRWSEVYFPDYGWIPIDCTWDDKANPADRHRYFGAISKTVLATTIGGGPSEYLGWGYNSSHRYWYSNSEPDVDLVKVFKWENLPSSVSEQLSKLDSATPRIKISPNPFKMQTTITFNLPKHSQISLKLYDAVGKLVSFLYSGEEGPGIYTVQLDGSPFPPGVYFLQFETIDYQIIQQVILSK